ncbi:MAG: ATP-binding protein [Spirochaetota bacterium]|nr:ATP-binding protein [Spirochaetota bacterium]
MKKIDGILKWWYPLIFTAILVFSLLALRYYVQNKLLEIKLADLSSETDYIYRYLSSKLADGEKHKKIFSDLKAELLPYNDITVLSLKGKIFYCSKRQRDGSLKDCAGEKKGSDWLYEEEIAEARHSEKLTGYSIEFGQSVDKPAETVRQFNFARRYPELIIRIAIPYKAIPQYMNMLDIALLCFVLLITAILVVSNRYLSRAVVKPIEKIIDYLKNYRNMLRQNLEYSGIQEIALLQKALNHTARDVQQKVNELSYRKNQVEIVIKNVSEAVLILDKNLKVMLYNQGLFSLLNINPNVYYGKIDEKYYYEIIRNNALNEMIEESAETRERFTKNISIAGSEDTVLEVNCIPLPEGEGMVLFIDNITEQYRLVEIKKSFVENASHEFKTPISIIKGYLETLIKSNDLSVDEQKGYLEKVLRNADRLNNLIKDLVTLNKLDESKGYFTKEMIDLVDIIEGCLDALSVKAESKDIVLSNNMTSDKIILKGNPEHLEIIFFNLIDNAITYSDAGGRVTVDIEESGGQITVLITDTGIGIPTEHRDRIFERFYRVDEGRSRKSGGTGLGLSIVKHAVSFHEGKITCSNNPNTAGTQFKVVLPVGQSVDQRIAQLEHSGE